MITTLIRNWRRPQERFAVTREPLADRLAMAPAGLVVDHIGVAQNLKNALGQYSKPDRDQTGIDERQAVAVLREKYEVVRAMFAPDTRGGFDYWPALAPNASSQTRLSVMAGAIEWVLAFQQGAASKETSEEGKKRAHLAMVMPYWRSPRRSTSMV